MQELRERIKSCISASKLRSMTVNFDKFSKDTEYEREGKKYTAYRYQCTIPSCEFISKHDDWNMSQVNDRIADLNDICKSRIHFCQVHFNPVHTFYSLGTELVVLFDRKETA